MMIKKRFSAFSLISILFLCFFVSLNIAWINPPNAIPFKAFKKIPIAWQYNSDVPNMIASSAFFPEYFKSRPTRINRPLYLAAAHYLGNFIYKPIAYIFHLESKPKSLISDLEPPSQESREILLGLSYHNKSMKVYLLCISGSLLILNFLMLMGILFLGYAILKKYLPQDFLITVIFMMVTTKFILFNAAVIHTNVAHLFNAILLLFLLKSYLESPSLKKIILYSLIAGLLMLLKQNYCNILLIWFLMLCYKKFKYFLLSFTFHFIPLFFWLGILRLRNIPYVIHEVQHSEVCAWILRRDFLSVLLETPTIFVGFLSSLVNYYTLPILVFFLD
ncbi:MAG: hypothetical protein AB1629_02655 [Candidatus Omnitrophota bacterium]